MKLEAMVVELGFNLSNSRTSLELLDYSPKGNRIMRISWWSTQWDDESLFADKESPLIIIDAENNVLNVDEIRKNPRFWPYQS